MLIIHLPMPSAGRSSWRLWVKLIVRWTWWRCSWSLAVRSPNIRLALTRAARPRHKPVEACGHLGRKKTASFQRACQSPVVAIMRWCTTPLGYGSKWVSPTTQPPGGTQGSTQPRPHRIFPPSSGENIQWGLIGYFLTYHMHVELVEALAWQKDPLPDAWQQYHLNSYKHADSNVVREEISYDTTWLSACL